MRHHTPESGQRNEFTLETLGLDVGYMTPGRGFGFFADFTLL